MQSFNWLTYAVKNATVRFSLGSQAADWVIALDLDYYGSLIQVLTLQLLYGTMVLLSAAPHRRREDNPVSRYRYIYPLSITKAGIISGSGRMYRAAPEEARPSDAAFKRSIFPCHTIKTPGLPVSPVRCMSRML